LTSIHATATAPPAAADTLVSAWRIDPGEAEITGLLMPPLDELLLDELLLDTLVLLDALVLDALVAPNPPPPCECRKLAGSSRVLRAPHAGARANGASGKKRSAARNVRDIVISAVGESRI
jgi:hypothetical protein